ncbi:MAG: phosphoribosylanthranilate isomerase [Bacteroidota bacterium]
MKLKVCGMKYPQNIIALLQKPPDYMGLIFYEKSARHVEGILDPNEVPPLGSTQLVGVFVNETEEYILEMAQMYTLQAVQLHGKETPAFCRSLRQKGLIVIKAFSIGKKAFDFSALKDYKGVVDYFLFDTKGEKPGGNGVRFQWETLNQYAEDIPFFLSGGISPEHIHEIYAFHHPMLYALDINSKFELEPGRKDIAKVHTFKQEIDSLK